MFMKHFYPQLIVTLVRNASVDTLKPLTPHPVKNFFCLHHPKEEIFRFPVRRFHNVLLNNLAHGQKPFSGFLGGYFSIPKIDCRLRKIFYLLGCGIRKIFLIQSFYHILHETYPAFMPLMRFIIFNIIQDVFSKYFNCVKPINFYSVPFIFKIRMIFDSLQCQSFLFYHFFINT